MSKGKVNRIYIGIQGLMQLAEEMDLNSFALTQMAELLGLRTELKWGWISVPFEVSKTFRNLIQQGNLLDYQGMHGLKRLASQIDASESALLKLAHALDYKRQLGWRWP